MSQEKAQLIAPIDSSFTVSGLTVSGVLTATTFDGTITGTADSITQGENLNVGVITALSFSGNLTGDAGGLIGSPNTTVGVVTATTFVGNVTGNVTGDVTGTATGIGGSIKQGNNLNVGIATAWKWYGDGSALTGVGASAFIAQEITATGAETIIDLSNGNLIYYTGNANTTVGFASTSAAEQISFMRKVGSSADSYTITWPDRIQWNGGTTPTLTYNSAPYSTAVQIFHFTTVDTGLTYTGWEEMSYNVSTPYTLWTWGTNYKGSLGLNQAYVGTTQYSSPVQIPGNWDGSLGSTNTGGTQGAMRNDGTLWMWGYDGQGQVGNNTALDDHGYSSPVQIPGTDWASRQGGRLLRGAIKTDGTLWTWGDVASIGSGALMHNDRISYSSPVQIPGNTWVSYGTESYTRSMGTKTDGTLWVCGYNSYGGLGLNDKTTRSSPTQIPGAWGTDYTKIALLAPGCSAAIKANGTLWSWGYGDDGQLGVNNRTTYSSPVQIGTDTTWSVIQGTTSSFSAIKTDGTLWSWGKNNKGVLGLNQSQDDDYRSSPTQVGTETTWSKITTAQYAKLFAVKTDGTLWSWGYNGGNFAFNDSSTTNYSSPKQVGTDTDWVDVQGNQSGGAFATRSIS